MALIKLPLKCAEATSFLTSSAPFGFFTISTVQIHHCYQHVSPTIILCHVCHFEGKTCPSLSLPVRLLPGEQDRSTPRGITLQGVALAVTLYSHPEVKTSACAAGNHLGLSWL